MRLESSLRGWLRAEPSPAAPPPLFSFRTRLALLAAFAVLIMLRLPKAVLLGRFMCEEGAIFFAYAWHHGTGDALWRSFGGYLNLAANAVTLGTARLVQNGWLPLEQAPRVTMAVALAFQTLPAALLLFWRPQWIRTPLVLVASLLVLALPLSVEEVWLNVLHIQFHLTLAAALLLALDPPKGVARWAVSALVLVLGPLCGPGAMVLGPLFLARAMMERSLPRLIQTGLLGCAGLVQLLVFFQASPVRGQFKSPDELAAMIFVRLGIHPFVGPNVTDLLGQKLAQAHAAHSVGWWLFAAVSLMFCLWIGWLAWRLRHDARGWLLAAGLGLAVASFGGGMLDLATVFWYIPLYVERYNFVPMVLFGLVFVHFVGERVARGERRHLYYGLLPFLLGALYLNMTLLMFRDGPDWHGEVAQWRQNHDYRLRTWPSDWEVDLSDRNRPCPQVTLQNVSAQDPSYCETNWLAKLIRNSKG